VAGGYRVMSDGKTTGTGDVLLPVPSAKDLQEMTKKAIMADANGKWRPFLNVVITLVTATAISGRRTTLIKFVLGDRINTNDSNGSVDVYQILIVTKNTGAKIVDSPISLSDLQDFVTYMEQFAAVHGWKAQSNGSSECTISW
jgi:hypothetical protein